MRTTLLILALATSGVTFGAPPSQTTTYIDGNLTGLTPNTGGTLTFDDDKAMYLRTGLSTVPVPYAGVSHAELGAVKENPHDVPFYRFWQRRQHKTETQLLIVNFKNDQGEDKTMTLELAEPGAASVMADLESRTGKTFVASDKTEKARPAAAKKVDPMAATSAMQRQGDWWGDEYWKTSRNADKWSKPSGSNDQQQ